MNIYVQVVVLSLFLLVFFSVLVNQLYHLLATELEVLWVINSIVAAFQLGWWAIAGRWTSRTWTGVVWARAGMVWAVCQTLWVPTGVWAAASWLPAAWVVRRGGSAGWSIFRRWHRCGHHHHFSARQFGDQVIDKEAKYQFDGDFRQNQSLECFESNQTEKDWQDNLQFQFH